jgi:hypothetical protein
MEDGTRCLHWNSASLTRAQGFTEDNHFKFHLLSTVFLWSIMFQIKNLRECRFWPKNLHRESRSRFTGQISNNSPNKLIQTNTLNNLTWKRLLDLKKIGKSRYLIGRCYCMRMTGCWVWNLTPFFYSNITCRFQGRI